MAKVRIAYEENTTKDRPLYLQQVALRLHPTDSVVVATTPLSAGTLVHHAPTSTTFTISHNVLEGHRFAIEPIASGTCLCSWGYPFGRACTDIAPGDYLANATMLASLSKHGIPTDLLPPCPNFVDEINTYTLQQCQPSAQVPLDTDLSPTFDGYARPGGHRGVGTRNYVLVLGTSAASGPFVQCLEKSLAQHSFTHKRKQMESAAEGSIDGIVCVAHTEGVRRQANNHAQTLRVLAGYVVHSNVGAVLLVDLGAEYEAISTEELLAECDARSPGWRETVPWRTHRLTGGAEQDVRSCVDHVLGSLLPAALVCRRTKQPLRELLLAEQCGGSDAFSGVSANPIIGHVAERIVRQGGAAVLAESDELMGAEAHVLSKCRSRKVAEKFLTVIQQFKNRMTTYGQSAEQNPSGGNNLRGIYNITLKSIGAGMKKSKACRLDHVLRYGECIGQERRGYMFMDSPGNDLESTAGQTASGCNFIAFTTGNGAVTNHPLVPTAKIITTTRRYQLVGADMDFNAGRLMDGCGEHTVETLGDELYDMIVRQASGLEPTQGETHGHAGTQLWRDWISLEEGVADPVEEAKTTSNAEDGDAEAVLPPPKEAWLAQFHARDLDGHSVPVSGVKRGRPMDDVDTVLCSYLLKPNGRLALSRFGLVLPTSLCSSQVCGGIVDQLNATLDQKKTGDEDMATATSELTSAETSVASALCSRTNVSRYLTLRHSEGCGVGSIHGSDQVEQRVLIGHLTHPSIDPARAVLLEHGCEKLHNSYFSQLLKQRGFDPAQYCQGSVQLDGGLVKVTNKIMQALADDTKEKEETSKTSTTTPHTNDIWETKTMPVLSAGITIGVLRIGGTKKDHSVEAAAAHNAGGLLTACLTRGVNVVVPTSSGLYDNARFLDSVLEINSGKAGLAFGQPVANGSTPGSLYVMDARGVDDAVELITGLAASGCQSIVVLTDRSFVPQHPVVPVTIVAPNEATTTKEIVEAMAVAQWTHARGDVPVTAFQITRGLLCVSA